MQTSSSAPLSPIMGFKISHLPYFIIILTLLLENFSVFAVNSPQMTFYTPESHESFVHLESKYGNSATLSLKRPKPFLQFKANRTMMNATFPKREKLTEFIVLGPEYPFAGVSAIIQEMHLRTNHNNNGCKDFVQFAPNESPSTRSHKICGHIDKETAWNGSSDPRLQRTFLNPDGRVHVYFYSDENLEPESEDDYDQDIGVTVVFTSYTVCPSPANSWKKLKSCSQSEKMSCIYSTLFCDGKIDCGFYGEFGIDEEGCYIPYIYMTLSIVGGFLVAGTLIYLFVSWVTKIPKQYRHH
ncbi:Low-density lipoprotein receptor-related protein 3 [Orchesella cincta]|uniref:Low-density lipoprotein receptor-related protein 3 n=1 Tax=Orchesella cincta TaxID=48709 RepID=A0A1D2NL12_ORCCI|nr:Low-density lipoprotein receptor-related protein 3 [Orchesella cincta]